MKDANRPGLLTGLLVGALLTPPLIALFFLADVLVGLPLVPFDLMEWTVRVMEGPFLGGLLTFGIDTMVAIIRVLNIGPTDQVAKIAEQTMFVIALWGLGVVVAGGLYAWLQRGDNARFALPVGTMAGATFLGIPLAMMSAQTNFTAQTPVGLNLIWIVGTFGLWGGALGWIYADLLRLKPTTAAVSTAAAQSVMEDSRTVSLTPAAVTANFSGGTGSSTPNAEPPSEPPMRRPESRAEVETLDRRQFLVRVGGATATLTVLGGGLAALLKPAEAQEEIATLPQNPNVASGAAANPRPAVVPVAGLEPAPGTRPEYTLPEDHYRIDISARPPIIDGDGWVLPIGGLVNNPMELTLDALVNNYEPQDYIVTLSCISNPLAGDLISTTKWTGVSLNTILDELDIQEDGKFLLIQSADGFFEYVSIAVIREDPRVMLAYAWNDEPLTIAHGFPLRIWIPNRYGMKQPKWITSIDVVETDEGGYWVRRGWSEDALVNATSVIDTVAVNDVFETGGRMYVPIGGIAWAGTRGISKVEVQIDDGEWKDAALRTPLSDVAWVIWRYDWAFTEGDHIFRVRAYEGNGTPQSEMAQGVRPDGATGIHSRRATL